MDQGHGHRSAHDLALMILRTAVFRRVSLQTIPKELPHLGYREG